MDTRTEETTLRDYLRVIFRHKAAIVATVATVALTTYVGLKMRTPVFEAQVKMLISAEKQVESPYYRDLAGERSQIALTQSDLVKSLPVIERTVRATRLYERPIDYERLFAAPVRALLLEMKAKQFQDKISQWPTEQREALFFRRAVEELRSRVEVEPIRNTDLFIIKVRDFTPTGAAQMANAISRSYVIFDLEQQAAELQLKYGPKHLTVKQLQDSIEEMTIHLTGGALPNIEAIGPATVKIIEQASIPLAPIGTSRKTMLMLAVAMSLGLGVLLAFIFDAMDQTLKSPVDVKTFLGLPLLGSIPRKRLLERVLIERTRKATRYVRFYQNLGDQLYLLAKEKGAKSILMTSALPSEGVTTIVANLGVYLAEKIGHRVLIIDANLRRPGISKVLKLPADKMGLADLLLGHRPFEQVVQDRGTNLSVLTAGKSVPNPVALLDGSRMVELMQAARAKYDLILVDCANLREFKDSAVIASTMDSIALVVNEGRTRRQVIKAALSPLEQVQANLIGSILNRRTFAIPQMIYERV